MDISDNFLWLFTVSYPSTCSRRDKRYELFDRRDLQGHFLETLSVGVEECNGLPLYALDDPNYVQSEDPDYLQSGVACDSDPALTCSRNIFQETGCASEDNICRQVVFQNICGQYAQAVRTLADEANTFGMYRRSEIMWKEDCAVSQNQVYTNIDPLRAAIAAQLAGVIVSFVFGITCGICLPGIGMRMGSQGMCKQRIHPGIEKTLLWADPWIHLFKLGPIIAAIVFIGQVSIFFHCGNMVSL
jgi:hypothetical protein